MTVTIEDKGIIQTKDAVVESAQYIAVSLDGQMSGVTEDGRVLWNRRVADGIIRTKYQQVPWLQSDSQYHRNDPPAATAQYSLIVEPHGDGAIYMAEPMQKLKRLPLTVKQLINHSPFSVDGQVFVGSSKSQVVSIDLRTGQKVTQFADSGDKDVDGGNQDHFTQSHGYPFENGNQKNIISVGVTEYSVLLYDADDSRLPKWNVTYTVVSSIDFADVLRDQQSGSQIDGQFYPSLDGSVVFVRSGIQNPGGGGWKVDLGAPAVSLFKVQRTLDERCYLLQVALSPPHLSLTQDYHVRVHKGSLYLLDGAKYFGQYEIQSQDPGLSKDLAQSPYVIVDGDSQSQHYQQQQSLMVRDVCLANCRVGQSNYPYCLAGRYEYSAVDYGDLSLVPFQPKDVVPVIKQPSSSSGGQLSIAPSTGSWNLGIDFRIILFTLAFAITMPLLYFAAQKLYHQVSVQGDSEQKQTKRRRKRPQKKNKAINNAVDDQDHSNGPVDTWKTDQSVNNASSLSVEEDQIVGYGSHGTVVFKGHFHGRQIAVKRLLVNFYDIATKEVDSLLKADHHPNVVRYYCQETRDQFLYIGLELCLASLYEVVESASTNKYQSIVDSLDEQKLIREISLGIGHLHQLNIVHRDIKPQNILIAHNNGQYRAVISDFGLCKKLADDQDSFHHTAMQSGGTNGWRAPETIFATSGANYMENMMRLTRAVDVFSAGLVFYFILTHGSHPYGDRFAREQNIINDVKTIDLDEDAAEAADLVQNMIRFHPDDRPSMDTVLMHPFFWPLSKRLQFLSDLSDRLDVEDKASSTMIADFNSLGQEVFSPSGWHNKVDRRLFANLGKYRKYDNDSLTDLLRAMRNKRNHFNDLPQELQAVMGPIPDGYYTYFNTRFPQLLMVAYNFVLSQTSSLMTEPLFQQYLLNKPPPLSATHKSL
ncbi:hypothetical protein MP228_001348 [Amoeboaphelidium protococcarum]|nr:hypothetical protein MP228_001348 [Amoeboaphelidium protococcarum]